MDFKSGNTLRKITNYSPDERYLYVKTDNPEIKSVEIFENVFDRNIQYSIKKRKRWMISSIVYDNFKDEEENTIDIDQPIMYSMIQYQNRNDSNKANYIMDTISGKEYGSRNISHREFNGGSVNYNSVLTELKRSEDLTKKIDNKNNQRSRGRTSKRNERRTTCSNEDLNAENICSSDEKSRDNCVYMNEYIYVNNPLNPNAGYRWRPYHKRKKIRANINNYLKDGDYIDDSIDDYFDNDYDDNEDDIDEEPESDLFAARKPFVITQTVISHRNELNGPKKRRKRKLHKAISCIIEEENDFLTSTDKYFDFIPENLPTINIEQSSDTLMDEMKEISKSFRCWSSNTLSRVILISLDDMECDDCRQFLALKILNVSENDTVNIRVLFNTEKFDFDQIHQMQFNSIQQLILFVQSKLKTGQNTSYVTKMQLWKLGEPMEKLVNTWKITKIETTKPIYCFDEEWETYEMDENRLQQAMNTSELSYTKVEKCEICLDHFTNEDMLSMNDCQHKICENCLKYHISHQIHFDISDLNCPVTNCKTALDCATILSLVSFQRYNDRKDMLQKQLMYKRFSKCNSCKILTLMNINKLSSADKKLDYLCFCGNIICGFCGEKQHWPTSCNEFKTHTNQIVKLNDKRIKPVKPPIPKGKGRNCPQCGYFVTKYKSMNMFCWMDKWAFCFVCGHKHSEKCNQKIFTSTMKSQLELYNSYPEPDSLRPKFYCQSMGVGLLLRDQNVSQLKQKLINIDIKIKKYRYLDTDSGIVVAQYSQIVRLVESIYISMYQLNRKDNSLSRDILKKSAKFLMFYVYQFESRIDKLNEIFKNKKLTQLKNTEVLRLRQELSICLNDAINYATKLCLLTN